VAEATLVEEAIAHYQVAASAFKRGWLRAAPP
jgi:hypothetical protein